MTIRRLPAHGFAIVSAIFILVVLAALGAFILSVSTSQHIGSALDVQGVRAYQAARAGIDWGLYRQLRDSSCPGSSTPSSFIATAPTLSDLTITVSCQDTPGGSGGPTTYAIISTACNQPSGGACPNTTAPGANYIERRLTVTF